MQKYDVGGSWWRSLDKPKPYAFAFLILLGLLLEFIVHFQLRVAVVYTHFYYLIIVVAGLWYGRKAIHIALLFGAMHIVDAYLTIGIISPDALIRACMFVIVAVVVGHIAEQMNSYHNQLVSQNRELVEINTQLESSQKAFEIANKKLNLLSSITRHDINNQLTVLAGYLRILENKLPDPTLINYLHKATIASQRISSLIQFTKNYENIGVLAPTWQDIGMRVKALQTNILSEEIEVSVYIDGVEIFADPLLEKVFENLIDNSRRHGEKVRHISLSSMQQEQDSLVIVYEDDGIGVPEAEKERIFEKGFGKNTGLGLFLTREILAITGLTIRESGVHGKGARFEILVPIGKFRLTQPATASK